MDPSAKTFMRLTGATALLLITGVIGFSTFAHIPPSEAFYQTLLILLTHYDHIGFTDTRARILVIILIIASLALVAYLLKMLADYMMGLKDNVRKVRVKVK